MEKNNEKNEKLKKELVKKIVNEFYELFMNEKVKNKAKINKIKNYLAKKYRLKKQLSNHIILSFLDEEKREKLGLT
jgi:histone acetyltransferase (RNA polymerase elongator complex component)